MKTTVALIAGVLIALVVSSLVYSTALARHDALFRLRISEQIWDRENIRQILQRNANVLHRNQTNFVNYARTIAKFDTSRCPQTFQLAWDHFLGACEGATNDNAPTNVIAWAVIGTPDGETRPALRPILGTNDVAPPPLANGSVQTALVVAADEARTVAIGYGISLR